MATKDNTPTSYFIDFLALLFIAFKLAGIIHWSWWFVLIPTYFIAATAILFIFSALKIR